MLPSNLLNLLAGRPKLIGVPQEKEEQNSNFRMTQTIPTNIFKLEGYKQNIPQTQIPSQQSLGLEEFYKNPAKGAFMKIPLEKIIKQDSKIQQEPPEQSVIVDYSSESHNSFMMENDILVDDFRSMIPDQEKPLQLINQKDYDEDPDCDEDVGQDVGKIRYIVQEEETKKFLIDALSSELQRLDNHTLKLEEFMGVNQKMVEQLKSQNTDIEAQVKTMVQEKRNQDRIKRLEDDLKYAYNFNFSLDDHLRVKLDDKMDQQRFNEELNLLYEDNEKLFQYADKIMARGLPTYHDQESFIQYQEQQSILDNNTSYFQQQSLIEQDMNPVNNISSNSYGNILDDRSKIQKTQQKNNYLNQFKPNGKQRTIIKVPAIKSSKKAAQIPTLNINRQKSLQKKINV